MAQARGPETAGATGQAAVQHIDGRFCAEGRAEPLALGGPGHEECPGALCHQPLSTGGGTETIAVGLDHRMHGNAADRLKRAEIRSERVQVDGECGRCGHFTIYGDPLVRCNKRRLQTVESFAVGIEKMRMIGRDLEAEGLASRRTDIAGQQDRHRLLARRQIGIGGVAEGLDEDDLC
ncbi:MAG: hypothetical protein FD125_729 [bacterium]|nr:MAG: hypothetical protein FD125_729 [bacterium]